MIRSDPAEIAAGHLAAGRVAEARTIYENLLRAEPTHVRALCGLGTIALGGGETARALELIGHAVAIATTDGKTVGNLGVAYLAQNKFAEAEDCFRRALDLEPGQPALHANFATALLARGDRATALKAQSRAVELAPDSAVQRYNLGNLLAATGQTAKAAEAYGATLDIDPGHVGALNNLSVLHKQAGNLDEAEALLDEALLHDPMNPELLANHADILLQRGQGERALETMRRAAGLAPGQATLRLALGSMLLELGRLSEAGQELAAAMRGAPENADIALALSRLLRRQNQLDGAQAAADRAVKLSGKPSAAEVLAIELLLMRGRYVDAWEKLDALEALSPMPITEPDLSDSADLSDTEIRLVAIDAATSVFATRFVPALAARGAELTVICPPVLARLFASIPGVARAVPTPDLQLAALGADGVPTLILDALPRRLRGTPNNPATTLPSFAIQPAADATVQDPLIRRVGLWWEGPGPGPGLLEALAGLPMVKIVALQTGPLRDHALGRLTELGITDRGEAIADFRDLAAAIREVDVLIAPDGLVANLGGSLEVETWVLVGRDGSWYWPGETQTSPWYPASRAFRQCPDGAWTVALEALRTALTTAPDAPVDGPLTGDPA